MWGEWIAGLREWDLFGGLTFDQRRYQEFDRWSQTDVPEQGITRHWTARRIPRDVCVNRFGEWVTACETKLRRRVDYVAAVEYQKNGWPHLHPLLDIRGLSDGDVRTMGLLWWELAGGNKLSRPRDLLSVCSYAAKYLSKQFDQGDILLSDRLGRLDTVRGSNRMAKELIGG